MDSDLSAAFAASLLAVELATGWVTLTPDPSGDRVGAPAGGELWVVTAFNPGGQLVSLEQNRAAHLELVEALADVATMRTIAGNADASYVEPGLAFVADGSDLGLGLAARFGQAAVFRWCAEALDVVAVGGGLVSSTPWRRTEGLHPGLHDGLDLFG